jgi:lipopolysaccharide transport system ATP-binding protein
MSDAIAFQGVSKAFRLYSERNQTLKQRLLRRKRAEFSEVVALDQLSFSVKPGSTLGLIGANGAGKSTALKLIAGIIPPDRGTVTCSGRVAALLELGTGFHPELSGRENVFLYGALMGLGRAELLRKFDGILDFSGLAEAIDRPVKTYSSGMYARLGFSVAMSVEPEILLVDEVLAVGDEEFQRRCAERISELQRRGITIVLVSHGMGQLRAICTEGLWIRNGHTEAIGPIDEVVGRYLGSLDDNIEHDEFGRIRTGSGPARVASVVVRDSRSTNETLSLGGSAVIEVSLEGDGVDVRLNVECVRTDGLVVAAAVSPPFSLSQSTSNVSLAIDRFPLGVSDYEVSTTVEVDGSVSDRLMHACRFSVVPGSVVSSHTAVTDLFGEWMFS